VVGCKADCTEKRVISFEEAKAYCDEKGFSYIETSAKTGTNVDKAFIGISTEILSSWEGLDGAKAARVAKQAAWERTPEAKRLKLIQEIDDRMAELKSENPHNKKAVKIAKVSELNALKNRLSETTGSTFVGVLRAFREHHPVLNEGFFSHRTRDLLDRYSSEEKPASPE
jgi:Ras family